VTTSRQTHFSDGEIIALDENGRISFNQLQHHRSQAQAILFHAFGHSKFVGLRDDKDPSNSCPRKELSRLTPANPLFIQPEKALFDNFALAETK
jgi:hypothetical protein